MPKGRNKSITNRKKGYKKIKQVLGLVGASNTVADDLNLQPNLVLKDAPPKDAEAEAILTPNASRKAPPLTLASRSSGRKRKPTPKAAAAAKKKCCLCCHRCQRQQRHRHRQRLLILIRIIIIQLTILISIRIIIIRITILISIQFPTL